jgi:hypothetical protein
MANKLISQLGVRTNVLVTDLVEFEPAAGAPSQKGTVTKIFTDASGNLAIDRDNRILKTSAGMTVLNWQSLTLNYDGKTSLGWSERVAYDTVEQPSIDYGARKLYASDGGTVVLNFTDQQPSSGPQTAGAIYTATEQTMLQEAYDALLAYGLLAP